MQTTSRILMIRPVHFAFNAETAVNNAFQVQGIKKHVQEEALQEFDAMVDLLEKNRVSVTVINDTAEPYTPDSIFPNNWISMHGDGTVVLYPMFAANRRLERKSGVLERLAEEFQLSRIINLTAHEAQGAFLEGTGSMVLDRDKRIAYACRSPRTHEPVLNEFCSSMHYQPVIFSAADANGGAIYHTNVMMCVADNYVVICLDSIADPGERSSIETVILASGKEIIAISMNQMNHFAGNMLQLENKQGEKLLLMSAQAYEVLTPQQITRLEKYNWILHSPLTTIETNGGGSARCMMAEIHLPLKHSS